MPAPATRRPASTKTSAPEKAAAPAKSAAPAKRKPAAKKPAAAKPSAPRDAVIARLAYSFAESRGFAPGRELDDWLAAEAHFEAMPEGERQKVA